MTISELEQQLADMQFKVCDYEDNTTTMSMIQMTTHMHI